MFEHLEPLAPQLLWILLVGFAIAFLLAFSVGANDVSNSFGTSVGSRVLTVTQACILATFFEVAGATLLGYSVCDTFRRNVYDVTLYEGAQRELMLGALSCLIGSAAWNLVATALKMPISGTHSIVGATIGFSVVSRGWESIKWTAMLRIVASWFASPLIAGCIASAIYVLISKTVICKPDPLRNGLKALPFYYGVTVFINVASIVISGPNVMGLNKLVWYEGLCISLMASAVVICLVAMQLVPRMRREITQELMSQLGGNKPGASKPVVDLEQVTQATTGFDNSAFKTGDELALQPARSDSNKPIPRPPIAPKPAFLQARTGAELEEVDLGPPGPSNSSASGSESASPLPAPVTTSAEQPSGQQGQGSSSSGSAEPASGTNPGRRASKHVTLVVDRDICQQPKMVGGERYEVFRLFSSLQIMTACFASFAHGTNDVSNAVAPLIPIWNIYSTGAEDVTQHTQVWILLFGGIGICTGLWAWGRAVMGTVGSGLTKLTPSTGFAIELGSAISVLCATKLGLPISTTHCKVGSVVIVGFVSAKFCANDNLASTPTTPTSSSTSASTVDWKLFGNIALTWICTVPLAGLASAAVMYALKWMAM